MLYRNEELDRAFDFVEHAKFDIFCLQEVPELFLKRLQGLSYHIAFRVDAEKLTKTSSIPMYNVILSKYPIEKQEEIVFEDYWQVLPFHTRLFMFIMKPFHFAKTANRGALWSDIRVGDISLRVFCLHLSLSHPNRRKIEFELAMINHDSTRKQIICGDFNILEAPRITILNWLLGGRISDTLLYKRERNHVEKRFEELALHNPLRSIITHPISRSQLDHILVSSSFSIKESSVLQDRFGSDHAPIRVEVK